MIAYPNIDPVALSIPLPGFLHPYLGDALNIHWYGLAYVLGAYLIFLRMVATRTKFNIDVSKEEVSDVVFTYGLFFGAIVGGRLGHVLFYDLHMQFADPLYFLKIWQGGMSFHGGLIGVMISMWFYANKKGFTFFQVTDWIAPQVPIALFLGRIANFINAELYGRPTDVPWAMVFPTDPLGLTRHPSQIYESFGEGLLLFLILFVISKQTNVKGIVSSSFLIFYGLIRFIIEFFRQPDAHIGYIAFDSLSMGQILCIPMMIIGFFMLLYSRRKI